MKKLLFKSMLLLCALIVGSSNVWADDVLYYTLDGTVTTGSDNGYSNYDQDGGGLTQNGMDWSVTGNTNINPWRIGGKNLTGVDREVYSKTAMGTAITKIELELGDINLTAVNSIKLIVASNSNFSTVIETIEKTSITATTLTFTPTAPTTEWATGAYYKFVFNVTVSDKKNNKYVELKSAKFYESGDVPTHTVTFSVNGETTSTDYSEDADIVFPADPADVNGKKFVGWTATPIVGTTDVKPAFVDAAKMGSSDVTYYAVFADATLITGTFTDNLELTTTGVEPGNVYDYWSGITAADGSDAVYSGYSAGGYSSIQLNSSNNSGIVSTKTGGTIKKVVVEWNSSTRDGRTLDIYGKTTAYTNATDLFDDNAGTKLGSVLCGTSTELSITGEDDYQYIGLRSNSGAMYLDKISIDWDGEATRYSGYCTTVPAAPAAYDVTANLANGAYWATFNSNAGNYQAPVGTQVFAVNLDGTTITMIPVEDRIVKSGEGVVLKQETTSTDLTTTITMTLDTETTPTGDFSGNSLLGTMTSITNPNYGSVYVLNGTNGAGFYKLASGGTIGANKAYLTYAGALAREFFLFDDEATGIEMPTVEDNADAVVYDLQGRRVAQPTKGLYIVNGKKVIK